MSLQTLQNYRDESGKRLYQTGHIVGFDNKYNHFLVKSESSEEIYTVDIVDGNSVCSCPDYNNRSKNLKCKHEICIQLFLEDNAI